MRIATRGSALALAQATWVAERLTEEATLVPLVTSGDRRRAVDDKREWVVELEDALLRGDADLAVHSAKDVPVVVAAGLELIAAPVRASPFDVLCGAPSLDALPEGARVGTASLRRASQLLARRPDLRVVELRGNVDTRLRKLDAGEADAIVLAAAGLERLGRSAAADAQLDLVPAAGQGTLVIEARAGDEAARRAVEALRDPTAEATLTAERTLVAALGADCSTPLGAHATLRGSGTFRFAGAQDPSDPGSGTVHEQGLHENLKGSDPGVFMRAWVGAPDGSAWIADELEGDDPAALGEEVARRLLAAGAAEVLGRG